MQRISDFEEKVEQLLESMSIEEKMGQIVGFYPAAKWSKDELQEEYPQGAGQAACFGMRELETLEQIAQYQRDVQQSIMDLSEHKIPAIFHMEGLCGVLVNGATSFPSGIGRASTWNPELERNVGKIVGDQAAAIGTTQVLAPVLDISRDSRFGRQGETYGEDPTLASAMGVAYVEGLQKENRRVNITATAKHFLGYHVSQGGIHAANCDIPNRLLREVYAKPFQAAITEAGLHSVMPSYGSLNGEPVSGSEEILTGLLYDEMGFEGLVVSDYCAVSEIHTRQGVGESITEAGLRALTAGIDIELPSKKSFNEELREWFLSGKADEEVLNRAVRRILKEKYRMGLFETPYAAEGSVLTKGFQTEVSSDVALQTARESIVLLKNDGILPIKRNIKNVAVIGYHAASTRALYGGYTYMSMTERWLGAKNTMAGVEEQDIASDIVLQSHPGTYVQCEHPHAEKLAKKLAPKTRNLLEELEFSLADSNVLYAYGYSYAGEDMSNHEAALQVAVEADLVILTVGGKYGTGSMASTGEGIDATSINIPPCQEIFIEKLVKLNKPFVVVHFDGRPISSDAADKHANAIIEAWNPADCGAKAIAEVLTGTYNPGGKLPVSVAYNAGQEPLYYNHFNGSSYHQGCIGAFTSYMDKSFEPRYFFGYGLSYTSFEYSELTLLNREIDPEGEVSISFNVQNTGEVEGDEVVQLYVKDMHASVSRPVMELAGFKRLHLIPGENVKISFNIKADQLAFIDEKYQWKIEAGRVQIMVGASSADIRLQDEFSIISSKYIDGKNRSFYAQCWTER